MREKRTAIVAVLFVLLLACAGCNEDYIIVSIGDSWAAGWKDAMADEIRSHGDSAKIYDKAIPGSTAVLWADTELLLDVQVLLLNEPEIEWAMISLGGNDLLQGYLVGGHGDGIFPIIDDALRRIVAGLIQARPDLKISLNAYDFLNFEMTPECFLAGQTLLGGMTYTQNLLVAQITLIVLGIAADYPQVTAVNLIGTMQREAGVPGAPNYLLPSPESMMGEGDCIHPNYTGYRALQSEIYDGFFGALDEAAPVLDAQTLPGESMPQAGAQVLAAD